MSNTMPIIHSNQFYPMSNGKAVLSYVGHKYPESQWAGMVGTTPDYATSIKEIGRITLRAEGTGPMYELENKLLSMARIHGAHMVRIESTELFEVVPVKSHERSNRIKIKGICQRFEL